MTPWWVALGREFRRLREARGMGQEAVIDAVAAQRGTEGTRGRLSKDTLIALEKGKATNPEALTLTQIAAALEVRIVAQCVPLDSGARNDRSSDSDQLTLDGEENSPAMPHPDHLVNAATHIAALVVEQGTSGQRNRLGSLLSDLLKELSAETGAAPSRATGFRGAERRRGAADDTGHRRRSTDKARVS